MAEWSVTEIYERRHTALAGRPLVNNWGPVENICKLVIIGGSHTLMPGSSEDAEPSAHSFYERYHEIAGAYDSTRTPVGLSILIDCFRSSASPLKHQRILDAGCGTGSYLHALKDLAGSLVGLDGSRAMLTQAAHTCGSAPNVTLVEGSMLKQSMRSSPRLSDSGRGWASMSSSSPESRNRMRDASPVGEGARRFLPNCTGSSAMGAPLDGAQGLMAMLMSEGARARHL
jgi:hypothetical protein